MTKIATFAHDDAQRYALARAAEGVCHKAIAEELTERGYRVAVNTQRITSGGVKVLLRRPP